MPSGELQATANTTSLTAKLTPVLYVAACLLAVVVRPTSFMLVFVAVVILYHAVLVQAAFLEVTPTLRLTQGRDGHALLHVYRRLAPVLAIAGLVLLFVELPGLGGYVPGLLVATGTALILAVKMISFAGTDAG
jgi:hypothetical protein